MKYYTVLPTKIIRGRDIFYLHATKGVPLEISAVLAAECNLVVDWAEFLQCADQEGWNVKPLLKRIRQACIDAGYNDALMEQIGTLYTDRGIL